MDGAVRKLGFCASPLPPNAQALRAQVVRPPGHSFFVDRIRSERSGECRVHAEIERPTGEEVAIAEVPELGRELDSQAALDRVSGADGVAEHRASTGQLAGGFDVAGTVH